MGRSVRAELLDLGPLHKAVAEHIQSLIDDTDLIFGPDASYETATVDGKPWSDPEAMEAVFRLIGLLPVRTRPILAERRISSRCVAQWR